MKKRFIVMCAALLPLASCGLLDDDKDITPSEGENYVSVSVSDVRDGYFKLDFECGEGTRTIEYAVCRAVNMKTDSVAFKAGDLDGVQRIELSDSVTVATVEYDCSEPLDFGPYTVYARAVSSTGEVSAPVKAQVCALTTGLTVEYVSRAWFQLAASYHGDEYICSIFHGSKQAILSSYGNMDAFIEYMRDYEHDLTPYMSGDGVYRAPFKYSYDTNGGTTGLDNQVVGFVTSDGFEITGVHVIELPLQEKDPSVALPDSLKVTIDWSAPKIDEDGNKYLDCNVGMDENTDVYFWIRFGMSEDELWAFGEELLSMYYPAVTTAEEAVRWNIISGLFSYGSVFYIVDIEDPIYFHSVGEDGTVYDTKQCVAVGCPVNSNGEPGPLSVIEINIPDEWFDDGEPAAVNRIPASGMTEVLRPVAILSESK